MNIEWTGFNADRFEHLIQALMTAQFGYTVNIYGDGPDGQREAMIECADYSRYLISEAEGKTIIQAKFKSQTGRDEDWRWLQSMLRKELDAFEKKALSRTDLIPDTWVFYTNLVLTATQDSGLQDKADSYVRARNAAYQDAHGRTLIEYVYVHGADWIRSMLDVHPGVYESYFGVGARLRAHLDECLRAMRDAHPSFKLMRPDEVDRRLFPGIREVKAFEAKGTRAEGDMPSAVWTLITDSWQDKRNRSIVIEGGGGIGKTVTLLSPPKDLPAPALYLHLYDLVENDSALSLSEYLQKRMPEWITEIGRLASRLWENGPSLLILLDGFNEIPTEKRRDVLHKLNDWRNDHSGAQFITVSRPLDGLDLVRELGRDSIGVTLAPLKRADIENYLHTLGQPLPPEDPTVWEILSYPLFLILYARAGNIVERDAQGYPLSFKEARSKGAIIWNYLQRELLRKPEESWILRCALACEYILPRIAWEMISHSSLTIGYKEAAALIGASVGQLQPGCLPWHLSKIWERYEESHFRWPELSGFEWNNFVLRELSLLKPERHQDGDLIFSFPHQCFRDCLAGLYLVNQAEIAEKDELPALWRQTPNLLALDYAADLMEEKTTKKLWAANRIQRPTNRAATYAMLELQKRRPKELRSDLDFSGMDLRGLSLVNYCGTDDNDLGLFQKPDWSHGTRLDLNCFRAPGHTAPISCLVMTPDDFCITGSNDYTLRVWDLRSGNCVNTFKELNSQITCTAVYDNVCISGSKTGALCAWDHHSGELLKKHIGHSGAIQCLAAIGQKEYISGSSDGSLRAWRTDSETCMLPVLEHFPSVEQVAVTKKGYCISLAIDGTPAFWNIESLKRLHPERTFPRARFVAVTSTEHCVTVSDRGNAIQIWDFETGDCLNTLSFKLGITDFEITQNNKWILVFQDGSIQVYDWDTEKLLVHKYSLEEETHQIGQISVSNDDSFLAKISRESVCVWSLRSGEYICSVKDSFNPKSVIAISTDGLCAYSSDDFSLHVLDSYSNKPTHPLGITPYRILSITVLKNEIAVASRLGSIDIWDLLSHKFSYPLNTPIGNLVLLTGKYYVSANTENSLTVWNRITHRIMSRLEGHTKTVRCAALTPENLLISGSDDGTVRVWDLETGDCLHMFFGAIGKVKCIAIIDARICVCGSADGSLYVWDYLSPKLLYTIRAQAWPVTCVAVMGGLCVNGAEDGIMRLWNYQTGMCIAKIKLHSGSITCIAITKDGHCISGSQDSTLAVWDPYSGTPPVLLKGHTEQVNCIEVLSDKLCISGSDDGTLRIWNYTTGECVDVLCKAEVDVSHMNFSETVFDPLDSSLTRMLWQNGATLSHDEQKRQEARSSG